jgi:multidrug efflux pump
MRRTLGTAVFSGMLGVTIFGVFLTPVFYYIIRWLTDRRVEAGPGTVKEVHVPPGASEQVITAEKISGRPD